MRVSGHGATIVRELRDVRCGEGVRDAQGCHGVGEGGKMREIVRKQFGFEEGTGAMHLAHPCTNPNEISTP